jgi:cytochrome P450
VQVSGLTLYHRSINNSPLLWQEPEKFMPERYLNHPLSAAAYTNAANPNDRDHFSYGAGRRICPGIHLAEKSLFCTSKPLLATTLYYDTY